MKKGIVHVIILALVIVNLILTSIMMFAIVPSMKNSNALVEKVAKAIDLEVEGVYSSDSTELSMDQVAVYNLSEKMTITLAKGADGKEHYAVITAALSMNKGSEDYKKYADSLESGERKIRQVIDSVVSQYDSEGLKVNKEKIRQIILEELQEMYDSKFITEVVFSDVTIQ